MKTYLDCIPCFFQQALRAARIAGADDESTKHLLDQIALTIPTIPMDQTPPETGAIIYRHIREIIDSPDPYKELKHHTIRQAQALYPGVKEKVAASQEPLVTAIRVAIAGNVIDFGVNTNFDIAGDLERVLKQEFAVFDYDRFSRRAATARSILYIGDNAGEAVFDRVLIQELARSDGRFDGSGDEGADDGRLVTFAVRGEPVINDITTVEADIIGLPDVAEVVSSGSPAPGAVLSHCTDDFIRRFYGAHMVISKGQGNYEALAGVDREVFFMLKTKCSVLARHLGVREGDIVLKAEGPGP